jgi:hypothetical protein
MTTKKRIIIVFILVAIIAVGVTLYMALQPKSVKDKSTKPVTIEIVLKDGKPNVDPATYLVRRGTRLEFRIVSNRPGKIGAPVSPPQTITFTKSPLTFIVDTPDEATYPITYQASESNRAIQIGSVVVKNR